MALLLSGGSLDPNLDAVAGAAASLGVPLCDLRFGPEAHPGFTWNIGENRAHAADVPLQPTAAFMRYDVFAEMNDGREAVRHRALGWFHAMQGWVLANARIRTFNRSATAASGYKPAELAQARVAGLRIPDTLITNEAAGFATAPLTAGIAKPVAGGDYCRLLAEARDQAEFRSGRAPMPAIVQPRLVAPEVRLFIVGSRAFAFEMRSESLDYRVRQDVEVVSVPVPETEVAGLRRLMAEFQMDFGAADFKTDPASGELVFLELNSSPMFAAFDAVARGGIARAIVEELVGT